MFGGVGFRQTTLTGFPTIDTANSTARSGMIFQDATGFVTIQNIYECQQDPQLAEVDFNTYLTNLQNAVILETCQKIQESESDFIQSNNVYPYEKSFINIQSKTGKFVGFQLEPTKKNGILGKVNWIELAFDEAVTFNVYLYNSNLPKSPLRTVSVTTVAGESVIVELEDWELSDDSTFKGGTFYWGYFEDDLGTASAFVKDFELSELWVHTRCHDIVPVTIEHTGTDINITTAIEKSETYGLNFGIDVYNDYTELFIRNKTMFYQPIYYQMAEKVYNLIITSVRSNRIERITNDDKALQAMTFEMYGSSDSGVNGIDGKLKRSMDNLKRMMFYKPLISRKTIG